MLNKKTIHQIIAVVVIISVSVLISIGMSRMKKEPEKQQHTIPMLAVDVMPISAQTIHYPIESQGVLKPKQHSRLTAEVSGRVVSVSDSFVAGGFVRKGELLLAIDDTDYKMQLRSAEANLARAYAALEEEKARGRVAEEDWRAYSDELTPELGLRVPQLESEIANLAYAKATLASAQADLKQTQILAPYDGLIRQRDVELGEFISVGSGIGQIYGTEKGEIRLPIAFEHYAFIAPVLASNEPQTILLVDPSSPNATWKAQLVRSEGVIDSDTRFLYLVAEITDPYQRNAAHTSGVPLQFGRFLHADVIGRALDGVYKIPRHLVKRSQVAVIDEQDRIQYHTVETIGGDSDFLFVTHGLENGLRIALTPVHGLVSGTKVDVMASERNQHEN